MIITNIYQYQQSKQSSLNSDGQQFHQHQLSKQSPLNSDGQQFYQYQQNEQSHLNSDGHQFHQYRQNEQSPLILTELAEPKKHPNTYYFGHSGPGLGQAHKCGEVTPVNGISILPSCVDMFVKVEQLMVLSSIIRKVWKIQQRISDPVNRRTVNSIATKKRQTMKYNTLHLKRKTNSYSSTTGDTCGTCTAFLTGPLIIEQTM